ncbi:Tat pathway signal sequence domain protein [Amycolatopsis sp. cg5]|uniref:Tat pathway signal sequence domain protein n=1 Tax=Amycolatopsis sp. cg5 TaxID=3238802 RepID=UPI0035243E48
MTGFDRRKALTLGAGALGALALGVTPAQAATWKLRWNPDPAKDGLKAFEGLEDDRAGTHPVQHIFAESNQWRFLMHTRDRDTMTDRQRNEVRGMRSGGAAVPIKLNETWRLEYQAYWPSALTATTAFTHIMQMKVSGVDAPVWTLTPRMKGSTGRLTIAGDSASEVDLTDYAPLQNKWIDVMFEFKASHSGTLRCVIKNGSATVVDRKWNANLWRDTAYLRPKWGIYRSLNSSGLKDCYQLIRNYKGYQLV